MIPEHFFVLHEPFLELPWNEYYPGWNYWKDVAINIAGFIPLGFLFWAYFSLVLRIEHPTVVTVAFGFAVSLTIEVLQAFLPTRNSGMTDLITNTFGTVLGALLCLWSIGMFGLPKKVHRSVPIPGKRENLQLIG
jgi:glycopeptide antibiotics resistance protein